MLLRKLTVVIFYIAVSNIQADTHIKTTKILCNPSPKHFINHTCSLKPINRYKTLAYMETYIRHILKNTSVNVGLYIRNDANIYTPFLVNFTQNICMILEKSQKQGPYMSVVMKLLNKFSNINHSCPFTGPLIFKNGYLDFSILPFAVPTYAYKIVLIFYEGYPLDYIGTVAYFLEIIESKRRQ